MATVLATVKQDAEALGRAMALLRTAMRRARRHRTHHEQACEDIRRYANHVRLLMRALQPASLSIDDLPTDASELLRKENQKVSNARRRRAWAAKG